MKKILLLLLLSATLVAAQYRDESNNKPDIRSGIVKNNSFGSLLGFINPDSFSMRHSFGLSYTAFGGYGGVALGVYTNSLAYKFSDRLKLETDISIVNSPYNSFGNDYSKQINGVYINRAQLTFKPSDNMNIFIQYRNLPVGYSPYGYGGYSPYYRDNYFNEWGF
ncbi:MAG: hypothetical protein CVV24_04910 [Ignavibacteriae bacterium HGW-Ignavibacteriae-3]|nr:MAG: hypothetical protein CVV24_04910 [Ignavibacteriae bacterium HGW-Ignavibacteriae-3]